MLGRAYFRTYEPSVITIRPSNNYGPWQYPEKLIPVVIAKALQNEDIPVYGNGSNIREMVICKRLCRSYFCYYRKRETRRNI